MRKLALGLVLSALPVAGFSASAEFLKCINAEDHSNADNCEGDENERQTERMEAAYKSALNSKGVDAKKLKASQLKWEKRLKKLCPETSATGGQFASWNQCLAEKTEKRAIELEK